MVAFTDPLTEALRLYDESTDARTKLLAQGQSYSLGGRSKQNAELAKLDATIAALTVRIGRLRGTSGSRIRRAVPE